jgi:DNA-binding PadR family transcriptional regulator
MEAQSGVSGKELTEVLYGPDPTGNIFDPRTSALYDGVLKPLVWAGLLQENRDLGRKLTERVYTTTPLWHRYLKLDVKKPRLHVVH